MKVLTSMSIALRALRVNRMRSALTMLGIIIGVAAVISMVAVGSGATERIQEQIASIGSNVIVVLSGSITAGGIRLGAGAQQTLTLDDAAAIRADCPAAAWVSPLVRGPAQIVYGDSNWYTAVQGVTPEYLTIRDYTMLRGTPFTSSDVDAASKVVVLGTTVATNLFGSTDPSGQIIRIKNVPFTVMGVLSPKGQSPSGQDQDDVVFIPVSTAKKKVLGTTAANASSVGTIVVQASGPQAISEAQTEIQALLRQRHHLQPSQDDDFTVRNLEEVYAAQETSARVMSILLGAIASVSLIVGGIGIMNIMLVSVTERTREIGLRQAVGAKTRDILGQFLIEAMTLGLLGGIAGIAVGLVSSALISHFAGWSTVISPSAILISFASSAVIGIFFGYYPARKAAWLDPIEALRYE